MANIREYSAPKGLGLQPSEVGVAATERAARHIGSEYDSAARAVTTVGALQEKVGEQLARGVGSSIRDAGQVALDYEDHQQISAGAAHGAELFNALNEGKDQAIKGIDPNDPAYGQKVDAAVKQWREQRLEPSLDQFREGFSTEKGQQWAEHFIDSTRQHMFISSAADISTAAGIGIQNSIRTTVNTASNTVNSDPSALPSQLDLLDHSVTGMVASSPLKGTASAKVRTEVLEKAKEQVVKSAAMGYIQKTGQMPGWATDPAYQPYINGAELRIFQKAAEAQQKANSYYERQSALLKKQQDDLAVHGQATDLLAKGVKVDPNNPGRLLIAPDFMQNAIDIARKNPDAPSAAATVRTMIDWAQQQQKQDFTVRSDPAARQDFMARMGAPDNPTTEIELLRAEADHKISPQDSREMRALQKAIQERPEGEVIKRDRSEFFKNYGPSIDPEMKLGNPTALGAQRIYEAQMDARRQEDALRQKDLDPHLVYDPRSEYFFGKSENIAKFRASLQDNLKYKAQTTAEDKQRAEGPKVGERKQFKQGWGVWNGKTYVPEGAQ